MMQLKLACFMKRFFIALILVALLASVDIAPDYPVQFAVVTFIATICIRLLWKSAERDKKRIFNLHRRLHRKSREMPQTLRRAA